CCASTCCTSTRATATTTTACGTAATAATASSCCARNERSPAIAIRQDQDHAIRNHRNPGQIQIRRHPLWLERRFIRGTFDSECHEHSVYVLAMVFREERRRSLGGRSVKRREQPALALRIHIRGHHAPHAVIREQPCVVGPARRYIQRSVMIFAAQIFRI